MNILTRINQLINEVWVFLGIVIVILIAVAILCFWLHFRKKNVRASLKLAGSLRTIDKNKDKKLTNCLNDCFRFVTVAYSEDKKRMTIIVPTKKPWDRYSSIEVIETLEEKLQSRGFSLLLQNLFPEYKFPYRPLNKKNKFEFVGTKI